MLILYLATLLNYFVNSVFLVRSLGFYPSNIMPCANSDSFAAFFPLCMSSHYLCVNVVSKAELPLDLSLVNALRQLSTLVPAPNCTFYFIFL